MGLIKDEDVVEATPEEEVTAEETAEEVADGWDRIARRNRA